MTAYAMYRVGETMRILLFICIAIIVFNLYPVTTIMIVLLAILNDGAILSIAYDNAQSSQHPLRWDMGSVLTIATVLGVVGVTFSFFLLYLSYQVWALPFASVQTLVYLKLSVAGHLGIFATRTKGPFWSSRPSNALLVAVFGTQAAATLIVLSGWILAPVPLIWVAVVWGLSVLDLIVFDLTKQLAYRWMEKRERRPGDQRSRWTRLHVPVRPHFYRPRYVAHDVPQTRQGS
jgi:H+-transporting ATPase